MIKWTKDDIKFIGENMISPMIIAALDAHRELHDVSTDVYSEVLSKLVDRVKELEYVMLRDRMFFLSYLSKDYAYNLDILKNQHSIYCDEYDRLNKHLLEDKDVNTNDKTGSSTEDTTTSETT